MVPTDAAFGPSLHVTPLPGKSLQRMHRQANAQSSKGQSAAIASRLNTSTRVRKRFRKKFEDFCHFGVAENRGTCRSIGGAPIARAGGVAAVIAVVVGIIVHRGGAVGEELVAFTRP